jgi:hypothetical protein
MMQVLVLSVLCVIVTAAGVWLVLARLRTQSAYDAERGKALADELTAMRMQFHQLSERFSTETSTTAG